MDSGCGNGENGRQQLSVPPVWDSQHGKYRVWLLHKGALVKGSVEDMLWQRKWRLYQKIGIFVLERERWPSYTIWEASID